MITVTFQQSISLDGFSAGPDQSLDNPLGIGGEALVEWVMPLAIWRKDQGLEGGDVNASSAVIEETTANVGAYLMGRNMFGGGRGDWGPDPWTGWWGNDPPYHAPVFVLTHFEREPLHMDGGTSFHFTTTGFETAFKDAVNASNGKNVTIAGGANTIQQALRAGVVDEFWINVVPVILGSGESLFDNLTGIKIEQVKSIEGDRVVHTKYQVAK